MRGRRPKPTALKRAAGNPGKRKLNDAEPQPPEDLPDAPPHLSDHAAAEWDRVAGTLHGMGVLTILDRAALAAYCVAYGRWVEAEEKLRETPALVKTPSGYVQQSPWLTVANKQLELMARYMSEFGMTPASRSRVATLADPRMEFPTKIQITWIDSDGVERGRDGSDPGALEVRMDEKDAPLPLTRRRGRHEDTTSAQPRRDVRSRNATAAPLGYGRGRAFFARGPSGRSISRREALNANLRRPG